MRLQGSMVVFTEADLDLWLILGCKRWQWVVVANLVASIRERSSCNHDFSLIPSNDFWRLFRSVLGNPMN